MDYIKKDSMHLYAFGGTFIVSDYKKKRRRV
jgi:hypothetical protein